ncbi:MAG: hypothetical protein U0Y08_08185 [Bacteroidia bacterium]
MKSWILCVSLLLLPFSTPRSIGCAGIDEPDVTESLLFNPGMIGIDKFSPLFISYHGYFETNDYSRDMNSNAVNQEEWNLRLKGILSAEELSWLIYKSTDTEIEQLRDGGNKVDENSWAFFSAVREKSKSIRNFNIDLNYLSLAKKAEKLTINFLYSWQDNVADTVSLEQLTGGIKSAFISCKDPFLKGRYGYQLMKTWHYLGQYETAIQFYESQLETNSKFTNSIQWRNRGYYAACLYKLQRYAEANLIYADIFRLYAPQRLDAYTSFHPLEEGDWNALLQKADREQQLSLWMLYGIYNDPIRGIEEISKLDPMNKEMELLLVRAVNIAENNIIKNPVYYWEEGHYLEDGPENYPLSSYRSWSSVNKDQLHQLLKVIDRRIQAGTGGIPVWLSAKAYVQYLDHQYDAAKKTLSETLLSSEMNIAAQQQNNITAALIFVSTLNSFDVASEEKLADMLGRIISDNSPKREPAERYILRLAGDIYERNGENIKFWLCTRNEDRDLKKRDQVTEIRRFMERKDLNRLEKYLCSTYSISLADIYDIEGTELMYEQNWAQAISTFQKDAQAGIQSSYGDPFVIHIVDCHDCDHSQENTTTYTKLTFAVKMNQLLQQINKEKNPSVKSKLCFEYANGLYNMTWYGNARSLQDTRINYSENNYYLEPEEKAGRSFFNCDTAQKWYETAQTLTKDPEFAAQCAWMAAKCEHADWLNFHENDEHADFESGQYFNLLKAQYNNTKYYQEIIRECGYFCTFNYGPIKACIKNTDE